MLHRHLKKGGRIARRIYTPERIINKLRGAEVFFNQESTVGEAARKLGTTEQTYFHWRREYGGIRIGEIKRSKEFELANLFLIRIQEGIPRPIACRCSRRRYYRRWLPSLDEFRNFLLTNHTAPVIQEFASIKV